MISEVMSDTVPYTFSLTPIAIGANGSSPQSDAAYATVNNVDTSSEAKFVSLQYVVLVSRHCSALLRGHRRPAII